MSGNLDEWLILGHIYEDELTIAVGQGTGQDS